MTNTTGDYDVGAAWANSGSGMTGLEKNTEVRASQPTLDVNLTRPMTRYRFAVPRPGEDVLTRVPRRTGAPRTVVLAGGSPTPLGRGPEVSGSRHRGAPYRQAFPRMAHEVRPEPLPTHRSRIAPDLLAIAVILAVVLAASLAGVRL